MNRYNKFIINGRYDLIPFIKIPVKQTDYYEIYTLGKTRLDILSYKYYNNPNYGWLILQANPECGSLEFNIKDKSILRIPYPLEDTISQYYLDIKEYKELHK